MIEYFPISFSSFVTASWYSGLLNWGLRCMGKAPNRIYIVYNKCLHILYGA